MRYRNKQALVTGGLGFIGSNLALRLVHEGARVTVIDSALPGCGANDYNLHSVSDSIRILRLDIADAAQVREQIADTEVIFNLAGEISHVHSMEFPERDLQINSVSQLRFLLECQAARPGVRVVYASTRQIYGVPEYLPIDEAHPIQPVDFNGVHKYAAAMYHHMLTNSGQLDAIELRLTNVYGPRMALDIPCQGFLSTFLRRLLLGEPLDIFGDGLQLRDPMYVDDAVEAFLLAGHIAKPPSRAYNAGGPKALSLAEIARLASEAAGGADIGYRPFPPEAKRIDIGSYYTDSRRIHAELGWRPEVEFAEGIARTIAYYREHLSHYVDPQNPVANCRMPEHAGVNRRLIFSDASLTKQ